jgi:MtN3 and saliva related transmembrane protein
MRQQFFGLHISWTTLLAGPPSPGSWIAGDAAKRSPVDMSYSQSQTRKRRQSSQEPCRSAAVCPLMDMNTAVGATAAFCTTLSYLPQLRKCWQTGETGDLSFAMFSVLAAGIAMWIVYGILQGDRVVIAANAVSLALLSGILYFKVREMVG